MAKVAVALRDVVLVVARVVAFQAADVTARPFVLNHVCPRGPDHGIGNADCRAYRARGEAARLWSAWTTARPCALA